VAASESLQKLFAHRHMPRHPNGAVRGERLVQQPAGMVAVAGRAAKVRLAAAWCNSAPMAWVVRP
jgi:hypothetical protein